MTRTRQERASSAVMSRPPASSRIKLLAVGLSALSAFACSDDSSNEAEPEVGVTQHALEQRAYVVSRESDELTVLDLSSMEILAKLPTGGVQNHMAELSPDFGKVYVTSSATDEVIVVDARSLEVTGRIPVGHHATHLSASRDGKLLAVMAEDEGSGAISFIDMERDVEVKRLPGFYTPHFMRFSADGRYGYVANINAHHITRVDMKTLEIDKTIALDGFDGDVTAAPDEGGFADTQIDADGMLYSAHSKTGRVLVYDTKEDRKLADLQVGKQPWIVYAEHPFADVTARVVPNFGDESVSVITGRRPSVTGVIGAADRESFGVNYSSLVPGRAFVMNRYREQIAVVDTEDMHMMETIDVGGTTETAATTADGKWVVASVSGSDKLVIIDALSSKIFREFEKVGKYPWSVTIPRGQNYCH